MTRDILLRVITNMSMKNFSEKIKIFPETINGRKIRLKLWDDKNEIGEGRPYKFIVIFRLEPGTEDLMVKEQYEAGRYHQVLMTFEDGSEEIAFVDFPTGEELAELRYHEPQLWTEFIKKEASTMKEEDAKIFSSYFMKQKNVSVVST